jgi:RimJ/RimL family protein N-acetyltransferase
MAHKTPEQFHAATPALETERLRLRELRLEDFEAVHAMWCEPEVYRYILGRASTREESWKGILNAIGHWKLLRYGVWAAEEKHAGNFIGQLGFLNYKRDIVPSLDETPELGWVLNTASHNKGYATEALTAIVEWGDKNLEQKTTACIIAPENQASIRVAEKIGYVEVVRTTYKDDPTILYHRPARLPPR